MFLRHSRRVVMHGPVQTRRQ